jgi:type 1 fimbria pilin
MKRLIVLLMIAGAFAAPVAASADPTITAKCSPAPQTCKGWYRQPVTIQWDVDGVKTPDTCETMTVDFDTTGLSQFCEATADGVTLSKKLFLTVDQTPPVVTGATASRPPDQNGWYRSPVQVTFSGTDATSGLLGCSATSYSGPNTAAVNLLGRCQDKAGNVSDPSPFGLRYDSVPPDLSGVGASPSDRKVRLSWHVRGALSVTVARRHGSGEAAHLLSGGRKGHLVDRHLRNGRSYSYDVRAVDPAGNTAERTITVVPGPRLLAPGAGAQVADAPLLRWTAVRGARYYNVQLYRGKRKLLSVWPTRPRLALAERWRFDGKRRRLTAGHTYRWFVWPGRGPRAANDYGRLVGTRTFTFRAP